MSIPPTATTPPTMAPTTDLPHRGCRPHRGTIEECLGSPPDPRCYHTGAYCCCPSEPGTWGRYPGWRRMSAPASSPADESNNLRG